MTKPKKKPTRRMTKRTSTKKAPRLTLKQLDHDMDEVDAALRLRIANVNERADRQANDIGRLSNDILALADGTGELVDTVRALQKEFSGTREYLAELKTQSEEQWDKYVTMDNRVDGLASMVTAKTDTEAYREATAQAINKLGFSVARQEATSLTLSGVTGVIDNLRADLRGHLAMISELQARAEAQTRIIDELTMAHPAEKPSFWERILRRTI